MNRRISNCRIAFLVVGGGDTAQADSPVGGDTNRGQFEMRRNEQEEILQVK